MDVDITMGGVQMRTMGLVDLTIAVGWVAVSHTYMYFVWEQSCKDKSRDFEISRAT